MPGDPILQEFLIEKEKAVITITTSRSLQLSANEDGSNLITGATKTAWKSGLMALMTFTVEQVGSAFVKRKKSTYVQEPGLFYSTFSRQNSDKGEQPRIACFMLKASSDDSPFAGAFYFAESENTTELKDCSKMEYCSADTDCEGESLN
ncbi:hypothetical protein PoB_000549100 [Plakobranchus ocellatus]|uniref:Uncharacterized protein n=1 Tax=Plakobranchus ocellatus TaxID=259542 RepID=A0AAV3Y9A3_9GAST|nr:hypothetical protein PoB_000549100 [Plakobranchus ocellatus]